MGNAMTMQAWRPDTRTVAVRVCGEIDLSTAARLDAELTRRIAGPAGRVVVDLSKVTFLAVAGLNCLIRAHQFAQERHVALAIDPGGSYAVNRVFALLALPFVPAPGAARQPPQN